jgi:hypothetical protein
MTHIDWLHCSKTLRLIDFSRSSNAGNGTIAKDKLDNNIKVDEWLKMHGPNDRRLTQGDGRGVMRVTTHDRSRIRHLLAEAPRRGMAAVAAVFKFLTNSRSASTLPPWQFFGNFVWFITIVGQFIGDFVHFLIFSLNFKN